MVHRKRPIFLMEEGLNVVSLPKTIDNDIYGTDMTFGFQSAADIATNAIDCIHTTAASHGRVFIVEVMGHKVGWLTLHAGIAGGADIILLPEIPYDLDCVLAAIERRHKAGKRFSILAVAEGAISKEDAQLSKKEYNKKIASSPYPSISYELGAKIEEAIGREVRITVPGHTQRGGGPDPYDRFISSRLWCSGRPSGRRTQIWPHGCLRWFRGCECIAQQRSRKIKICGPEGSRYPGSKGYGHLFR